MPKISGLALGEIKKVSGLGLGSIKKVSGLGLGLIWQDLYQQGMTKNGNFDVTTTQATVTAWTAEANSIVSGGNALQIVNGGPYIVQATLITEATGSFGSTTFQGWIIQNGNTTTPLVTGSSVSVNRPSSGNVYTMTTNTPVALANGDLLTVQSRAGLINVVDITGGVSTWLRAIPA